VNLVGKTVGRFKVVREIGKGGMGVVYEADDLRLPRRVALKFLPDDVTADDATLTRFRREAHSLSRLNHPHICTIYDIGTYRRRPFIAMERLEGRTLRERLQEGPLALGEVFDLGLQIADALGAAHAQEIVHRDVKPGNVFITTRGVAKLLDFGLAKERRHHIDERGSVSSQTAGGRAFGTPGYMSPEQIRESDVDGRSDLFSLGALLYRMTCGRSPFDGGSLFDTIKNILDVDPPPVSAYRKDAPPGLDQVIATLLRKNRDDRYATTHDLMEALRRLRDGMPAAASALASVAVLPFENRGPGPDDYFGQGLADELITCLARLEGVRVVSRGSAFELKGDDDVTDVGRRLRVRHVLYGTVHRSRERVRISARLVEVATGTHLWSQKYERDLHDIFDLQEEIAERITNALQARLPRYADRPLIRRYTDDPEIYNMYLQGRYWLHQQTMEGFARGYELFTAVLRSEPRFAPALAGLADYYSLIGFFGVQPPMEVWPEAKARAEQAIAMDPSLAVAHTSLALALSQYDWDFSGAERQHQEAIRLSPGDARARYFYGLHLMLMGRLAEAAREMRQALTVDPLSKQAISALAYISYYGGDYDGALRECRRAIALDATYFEVYGCLGLTQIALGRLDDAIEAFREADRLTGGVFPLARAFLAYALGCAGQGAEAQELLTALYATREQRYVPPAYLAVAEMGLGQIEPAFKALEDAYTAKDGTLLFLRILPVFRPLRTDRRFENLCRRLALPDPAAAALVLLDAETQTWDRDRAGTPR
jgi:TolB-like protein/Flp pilus assembly protein TadD